MSKHIKKNCKYYENVPCMLGDLAPYCQMMCELNDEAKQLIRKQNVAGREVIDYEEKKNK